MKNLLKKILSGFEFGVTVLMIAYLGIYYLAGQEIFTQEIANLGHIENFQCQLITVGLCGSLCALATFYIEKMRKSDVYKTMFMCIVSIITYFIVVVLLIKARKDNYISEIIAIIEIVILGISIFKTCAREAIDEFIINKKIKEINKDIKR